MTDHVIFTDKDGDSLNCHSRAFADTLFDGQVANPTISVVKGESRQSVVLSEAEARHLITALARRLLNEEWGPMQQSEPVEATFSPTSSGTSKGWWQQWDGVTIRVMRYDSDDTGRHDPMIRAEFPNGCEYRIHEDEVVPADGMPKEWLLEYARSQSLSLPYRCPRCHHEGPHYTCRDLVESDSSTPYRTPTEGHL